MINAHELRIGNIVIVKQGDSYYYREVVGAEILPNGTELIKIKDWPALPIADTKGWEEAKDVFPVMITEDLLLQIGFIKLFHQGNKELSLVIDDELTIEIVFYNDKSILRLEDKFFARLVTSNNNDDLNIPIGSFTTYRIVDNCKQLHHLQNLYSDLTGNSYPINYNKLEKKIPASSTGTSPK